MKAFKHVTGIVLATLGVVLLMAAYFSAFDPDADVSQWMGIGFPLLLGIGFLAGALGLLWRTLAAPVKNCPRCGSAERESAKLLRTSQNPWLFIFGGPLLAALWGASRYQPVKCSRCEMHYRSDSRGTRIAGVLLWIFLLLACIGVLAEIFEGR